MASKTTKADTAPKTGSVEDFLAALEHPFKPEILALRTIVLDADAGIAEGIKWNAPASARPNTSRLSTCVRRKACR